MCGRFVLASPVAEIGRVFGVAERPNLEARWNVAPTQTIATIRARSAGEDGEAAEGGRQLVPMRWGLVPFWAKDAGIGSKMINARADTLAEKPAFREAFRRRRVLIPADGFYEWQAVGGKKQPYYIRPRNGGMLAFAGLWESWRGPKGEPPLPEPLLTATIVTTDTNRALSFLHDRMPVILDAGNWDAWLDPATPPQRLQDLLRPAADDLLETVPVSTAVNSVRNEGEELIRPMEQEPRLL
ncbi:SOS response-associated peptidase [Indioceanicola profundi]|uniref:SOS response-associated peptidase n=1 Tax=Indioceanicola profundi TaxID=2220096 RepID=UPI000E6ACCAF|nr:SOS response-associated peptidase [Indioceanicola profundi]